MGHVNVFFNLHKGPCASKGFYQLLEFLLKATEDQNHLVSWAVARLQAVIPQHHTS